MIKCSVCGVPVRISPLIGVTLTVLLYVDNGTLPLFCLAASFLHELGHLVMVATLRHPPSRVTIGLWGIRIERKKETAMSYTTCAAVSLAGPLVNLLCAALLYAVGSHEILIQVPVLTGCLHLLPIETLDGGQALKNLLCLCCSEITADRAVFILSICLLVPITALGLYLFFYSGYNFTLPALCFYLILEMFFSRKH